MTDAEIQRLESLAREATPGPWHEGPYATVTCDAPQDVDHHACRGFNHPEYDGKFLLCESVVHPQTRAYIAAANPAAVLALIERVRELEADAGRFLYLANEASIHGAMGERFYLEWHGQGVDIRDAIDAAMKEDKP